MTVEDGSGRRERRKAETRNRVLDAARQLFEHKGYEAVTIRMIADEAQIAVGSIFTTFESKSDVLAAIVAEELEYQVAEIDSALDGVDGVLPRLRALFRALYLYHDRHEALLLQAQSHSWVRALDAERAVRRALSPTMKRLKSILSEGCDCGEVGADVDLALIVEILFACYITNYRGAAYDGWSVADMIACMDRQIVAVMRGAGPNR